VALPKVDPNEVELALDEFRKPWQMANSGGYAVSHHMSWERASIADGWRPSMPRKLTEQQAHLLRETLLRLGCRITIKNHSIFISGRLPLTRVRAKQGAS